MVDKLTPLYINRQHFVNRVKTTISWYCSPSGMPVPLHPSIQAIDRYMKKNGFIRTALLFATLVLPTGIKADDNDTDVDIKGTVYDINQNEILPAATVYVEELGIGVITDNEGVFRIAGIPEGTYTLKVQYLGYQPTEKTIRTDRGAKLNNICLKPEALSLSEVIITEKSQARLLREQAMPVTVISMQQLQGTVSDVQSILAKTVGVTVRATGGLGSTSRLSVRGLEGKRIGFFIDETPMNDQSDFVDLNDIPVDMIDRIEI